MFRRGSLCAFQNPRLAVVYISVFTIYAMSHNIYYVKLNIGYPKRAAICKLLICRVLLSINNGVVNNLLIIFRLLLIKKLRESLYVITEDRNQLEEVLHHTVCRLNREDECGL